MQTIMKPTINHQILVVKRCRKLKLSTYPSVATRDYHKTQIFEEEESNEIFQFIKRNDIKRRT